MVCLGSIPVVSRDRAANLRTLSSCLQQHDRLGWNINLLTLTQRQNQNYCRIQTDKLLGGLWFVRVPGIKSRTAIEWGTPQSILRNTPQRPHAVVYVFSLQL